MNEIGTVLIAFLPFLLSLVMFWWMNRKVSFFEEIAFDFSQLFRYQTEKDDEGKDQVLMDPRLVGLVDALGSRMATSLKMSVLGGLSGQARLDKGLKGAMAQDFVQSKAPILKALGDLVGFNTADYVAENPDTIMSLLPMLQGFMKQQGSHNSPGSGGVGYANI